MNMADWKKAQEPLIEDLPWAWLVNVDHLYFVNEKLSLGNQPIHPHSHALDVLCNLEEWCWKSEYRNVGLTYGKKNIVFLDARASPSPLCCHFCFYFTDVFSN